QRDLLITVICSDSLSCLKALKGSSNNTLINIIRDELFSAANCIVLLYTPAHGGIFGNEEAD
ncbi:hypothetical protein HHI36_004750, partial [Cryptolaemus montrouzieri]